MMSARAKKLLELAVKENETKNLLRSQQQDIMQSIPVQSVCPVPTPDSTHGAVKENETKGSQQQDIMQSIPGPSGYRVPTPDSTLGDFSSDDDVMDRSRIPNSVQDADQLSSSSDDSTYTRNTVTSSVTAKTQGNVRVKRKRGIGMVQRKLRKERYEKIRKGEEYTNQSRKKILSKPVGVLQKYRLKCKTKFTDAQLGSIFTDYRSLQTRDMQRLHLSHHILLSKPVRVKTENTKQKRDISVQYGIEIDGRREKVCQQCFRTVYGENRTFIYGIIEKKKKTPTGIMGRDERGRHEPKIKHSTAAVAYVHNHIASFPAYESHCSRSHTTKQYLDTGLNLQKIFSLYLEQHEKDHVSTKAVSLSSYSNIFKSLHLKFKKSHNDTCSTCDKFVTKIKITTNDIEKNRLHEEHVSHQQKAKFHYECKSLDKQHAKSSNNTTIVAICDLQQCLATPFLNTGVSILQTKIMDF
ncbi:uncharacterized protein [Diabrotica undecimpunctata]|uniref:uncharacterized protein n=1 Tax=Diabrotica undecimpunctata TaxID=50387 RepID=UPI003B63F9ED